MRIRDGIHRLGNGLINAYLVEEAGKVTIIDAGVPGYRGHLIASFTADPAEARRSLDRLAGIDAGWVLPGHGAPWTGGVAAAIEQVRALPD